MLSDLKSKGIQMSQVHTLQMGRLIAAGSKSNLAIAIDSLAALEALHIVDYDDSEEGFSLGTPGVKSEEVGRDLVKARAARSVVNATAPSRPLVAEEIRSKLDGGLQKEIEGVLDLSSKISDLEVCTPKVCTLYTPPKSRRVRGAPHAALGIRRWALHAYGCSVGRGP